MMDNLQDYLVAFDDDYEPTIEYWVESGSFKGNIILAKKRTADEAYQWARDYVAELYGSYDFQHNTLNKFGAGQITHVLSPMAKLNRVDVVIYPVKVK